MGGMAFSRTLSASLGDLLVNVPKDAKLTAKGTQVFSEIVLG
jgi:hypothetical protein